MSKIVQYIIVRSDLKTDSLGTLAGQCCQLAAVAMDCHREDDDDDINTFLEDLVQAIAELHVLEVKGPAELSELAKKLKDNHICHVAWTEEETRFLTGIAIKPYIKEEIHDFVKHLEIE